MDTPPTSGQVHGADVDALLATALACAQAAEFLELVDLRTYDGLSSLAWRGRDAERARGDWDEMHAVTLHLGAEALVRAAGELLRQADEQEAASLGTGAAPAPVAGAADPTQARAAAREALRESLVDRGLAAADGAASTVRDLSTVSTVVDTAMLLGMRADAVARLAGPLAHLSFLGTAAAGYDALRGAQEGDAWRATEGTVSAVLGYAATQSPVGRAAAAGWTAGNLINAAKEGTRFDHHFQGRMEPALDAAGAVGMAWMPVALAQAGGDTIGEVVNQAKEGTRYDQHFQRYMDSAFEVGGLPAGILATPGALAAAGVDTAIDAGREALTEAAETYRRVRDAAGSPTLWSWQTLGGAAPDDDNGADEP